MAQRVLRVNQQLECNQPLGYLNIVIKDSGKPFETVSFYCNQLAGHRDACKFVGKDLTIFRNRP